MNRHLILLLAIGALVMAARTSAHHSFAATYLEDQRVTVEGELVQFLLRSPHSYVHLMVTEKDGTQARYTVEWGAAGQLSSQKITKETLRPGDHVVIQGNPGRNAADRRVRLLSLRRPKDGFSWGERAGEAVN